MPRTRRKKKCGSLASSHIRPTDKPESRDKKITKATEKMFKNYPPQSR
jgi:hypothetical protein